MSSFTPGPWIVESLDDSDRYNLPNGPIHQILGRVNGCPSTVCTVEEYCEVPGFDANRIADACLISAAPELFEVLRYAVDVSEEALPLGDKWREKARSAIAKARGEE